MTQSPLRIADLSSRTPTAFDVTPTAEARAALAEALGIRDIRKLRFSGEIAAVGRDDWRLTADLGASVVQDCVVTLEPVLTRLDEKVERLYVADFVEPEGSEVEMPEDDTVEPLPTAIDLTALMAEALALALPAFPRAPDADLGDAVFAAEGVAPMTDEDAKPFAGLGALRDQLSKKSD